jgi:hypothetical protein
MWRDLRFALSYLLLAFPLLALVAFVWPLPQGTEPLMVFVWAPLAASLAERVSRPAHRLPLLVSQLRWGVLRSTLLVVSLFCLPVVLLLESMSGLAATGSGGEGMPMSLPAFWPLLPGFKCWAQRRCCTSCESTSREPNKLAQAFRPETTEVRLSAKHLEDRAMTLAQEGWEVQHKRFIGRSTVRAFGVGQRFEILQSPLDAQGGDPFQRPLRLDGFASTKLTQITEAGQLAQLASERWPDQALRWSAGAWLSMALAAWVQAEELVLEGMRTRMNLLLLAVTRPEGYLQSDAWNVQRQALHGRPDQLEAMLERAP